MTEQELQEIEKRIDGVLKTDWDADFLPRDARQVATEDAPSLLAEVRRLRALFTEPDLRTMEDGPFTPDTTRFAPSPKEIFERMQNRIDALEARVEALEREPR